MGSNMRILPIIAVSTIICCCRRLAPVVKVDLANETAGAEPKALVPVVGIWRIEDDGGKKVLAVDGRQWKEGQSSAGIADKARALYGERYAEFLDRVQAYAYFPYVVAKDVDDFQNGEIDVRFECLSGRIDQGAGILFNLKPNGDYLTDPCELPREQSRAVEVRAGPALPGEVDQEHADGDPRVARSQGPHRRRKGRRLSRRQALSRAQPAGAGVRAASGCGRRPTATCISMNSPLRRANDDRRDVPLRFVAASRRRGRRDASPCRCRVRGRRKCRPTARRCGRSRRWRMAKDKFDSIIGKPREGSFLETTLPLPGWADCSFYGTRTYTCDSRPLDTAAEARARLRTDPRRGQSLPSRRLGRGQQPRFARDMRWCAMNARSPRSPSTRTGSRVTGYVVRLILFLRGR